ncbi:MAG: peptide deformylase [Gemmatimonadota bacterium]
MIRRIRFLGDPALREPAAPVERFDAALGALVEDLIATMYAADGIGLAAPQVAEGVRVAVIDVGDRRDGSDVLTLVNPRIVRRAGTVASEEGCLSIPGLVETIERSAEVDVEYVDPSGEPGRVSGTDLVGRALQHEIDHLEGILFIDHLTPLRRSAALSEWRQRLAAAEHPDG